VESTIPDSRKRLLPAVAAHADYLTTTFDMIDEPHREAGEKLAAWIAANYQPGQSLHIILVCTGNSRRSILGSTLGNVAAAYYGMPDVHFHSGGTAPTAFNARTIACLKEVGVESSRTAAKQHGASLPRRTPFTACAGAGRGLPVQPQWRQPSSQNSTRTRATHRAGLRP
jgi:hypothetical protein